MKKALFIASAVAATALFAIESNEISFLPVTPVGSTSNLKLLAVPFNGYGTGDSESISVADVLLTDGLANGDKLYIPTDEKGKYNQYLLSNGTWEPAKVVTVSGSDITAGQADSSGEATIARGQAFWIETEATNVKLLGQAATQTKTEKTLAVGYQLLAPTTSENAIQVNQLGGAKGDLILLADGTRYQKTASGWKNVATRAAVENSVVIQPGVGFWYKAMGLGGKISL